MTVVRLSSSRVHPASPPSELHRIPLSILDSSVVNFACTAGVWFYYAPLDADILRRALGLTLARGYEAWAGQIQFGALDHNGGHTRRFGRVLVEYGRETDPGVDFVVAESESSVPIISHDQATKVWAVTDSSWPFIPSSPPALHNLVDYAGLPGVLVQVTKFKGGGTAVGVKMAHCLGDAQTLIVFMKEWASVTRAILNETLDTLAPPHAIFQPNRVDQGAAGDIDAPRRDDALVRKSRDLPMDRYDWWNPATKGVLPSWGAGISTIPDALKDVDLERGQPMPWDEWDFTVPVKHTRIRFSADDVDQIWRACLAEGDSSFILSKFDALQAFLWILIIRARQPHFTEHGDETAKLNITLGARERLPSPVPSTFVGSPIFTARVEVGLSEPISLRSLAINIRQTIGLFTPDAVSAVLHDMAHEPCPYRIWGAFLGRRHSLVTSWLRLGVFEVDFGKGSAGRVEAVMPSMDGCMHVMDDVPITRDAGDAEGKTRWYEDGIVASLHLREDVTQRLIEDPMLVSLGRGPIDYRR